MSWVRCAFGNVYYQQCAVRCRKIALMVLFWNGGQGKLCAYSPTLWIDRILSLCWNIIVVVSSLWRVDWGAASGHDVCRRWGDWSDFSKKKLSTLWAGKISPRHWVSAQKPWQWWGRPARLNPTVGRLLCQDGGGVQTWNMQSGHLAPALLHLVRTQRVPDIRLLPDIFSDTRPDPVQFWKLPSIG